MTQNNQKILNWLENEKKRDKNEIESTKKKYIKEIKGLTKEQIFKTPKKLTLWQRLKKMILGL